MVLGTVRQEAGHRERQPKALKTKLAQGGGGHQASPFKSDGFRDGQKLLQSPVVLFTDVTCCINWLYQVMQEYVLLQVGPVQVLPDLGQIRLVLVPLFVCWLLAPFHQHFLKALPCNPGQFSTWWAVHFCFQAM
jgi:hypothetical protein